MKKKILGASAAMALVAVVAFNLNFKSDSNELSALNMDNIEALASGETGGGKVCYNTITSKEGSRVFYCPACDWVDGTDTWYALSSTC